MLYGCAGIPGAIGSYGTLYDIKAAKAGFCGRFMALDTRDIKSVRLQWDAVTIGTGTMSLSICTIDATTGKPTINLYDANATMNIVPVNNAIGTYIFATLPTTGLVPGTEYGVVLNTTAAFTACGIRGHIGSGQGYLSACYSTADMTAGPIVWTELSAGTSCFVASFVMEDNTEETFNCHPFGTPTSLNIYGTMAYAAKFTIPHTINVAGVYGMISKNGTPAGDLRCRVMDSANNIIANTTVTLDKDSILGTSTTLRQFHFSSIVTLYPGTYRIVFDSAGSATSANCWMARVGIPLSAAVTASKISVSSTTPDVTAIPIVWTDDATGLLPSPSFILDDIVSNLRRTRITVS